MIPFTKYLWQGASAVLAVALAGSVLKGCALEKDNLELQVENQRVARVLGEERAASAAKLVLAQDEVRTKTGALQKQADNERKKANETQASLRTERDRLAARLREYTQARPTTNDQSSTGQTNPASNTGQVASISDGQELPPRVREEHLEEAHRAELIRQNLLMCYRYYDRAQEALASLFQGPPDPSTVQP